MGKGKEKSLKIYIGFLILVALISTAISFNIINDRQNTDIDSEKIEEVQTNEASEKEDVTEHSFKNIVMNEDMVFLESYYGPNAVIELNKEEIETVSHLFKSYDTKYIVTSDNKEISYLYAVHIKNKNIKIKLNQGYLLLETPEQIQLYSVEDEKQQDLISKLEEIYMVKYNDQDIFHLAESITIRSKDEGIQWELSPTEIEELENQIYLISPISKEEVVGVPRNYPDYLIELKVDDRVYTINLFNEDILVMDSIDSISYYKYKDSLWEYINSMYSIENSKRDGFKYLLQSTKIVIDAEDDSFDIEDSTYYNIEIPRYIISAEKHRVEKLVPGEDLIFTMLFTVNNKEVKVAVYENQIVFGGQVYRSEKIGEAIISMLNV